MARSRSPSPNHAGRTPYGRELLPHREGLVGPAPALLLVDAAAEGVHHGVQVGADPQPEQRDVVAGVADDGDLGVRDLRAQAPQEPGGADSAGGDDDVHGGIIPAAAWRSPRRVAAPSGEPSDIRFSGRLETSW